MDIDGLIAAAVEIDLLAKISEQRAKAWNELARDAKRTDADRLDIARRKRALNAGVVVDFSTAIDALRTALRATTPSGNDKQKKEVKIES